MLVFNKTKREVYKSNKKVSHKQSEVKQNEL